jgi:hypothetical protein
MVSRLRRLRISNMIIQGSHILTQLLAHPSITSVAAYTRRELPNPSSSSKLQPLLSTDTSTWASLYPRSPAPKIFLSGLGTTRAAAGSLEAQKKIDLELNYELAKAAKEAGTEVYVLISTGNANSKSSMAYLKMKGELDDRVKALGFKYTLLLKPGLLLGQRSESRFSEGILQSVAGVLGKIHKGLVNGWTTDAEAVGRAAVEAGMLCVNGEREEGVWEVGQADILRLGAVKS